MQRPAALARLIESFEACSASLVPDCHPASAALRTMCQALRTPSGAAGDGLHQTLAACHHLDAALANTRRSAAPLAELANAFQALAPQLYWRKSTRQSTTAFSEGHANTEFVGPGGLERRSDVVLGASLLAPGVAYPYHQHPPEEIYLVLSEGDWFRAEALWYTPGMGGIVHHPPGVTHAMRAGPAPLLAVWCLWTCQ